MELVTEHAVDGSLILRVSGRLDAHTIDQLKTAWANPPSWTIYIDLSATTFIDSMGLAVLVQGLKLTRQHNGELILVRPSTAAQTILTITAMHTVFTILPTVPQVAWRE